MATAHDSHDQRPARAALRISDCLSHGAVPELLRADETFEPFRGCAGILASGRMLLEPLKQAVSIEGRGRRWITDALPPDRVTHRAEQRRAWRAPQSRHLVFHCC